MAKAPLTAQQLREAGYKVEIHVFRLEESLMKGLDVSRWNDKDVLKNAQPITLLRDEKTPMWPFGGVTQMLVWKPENRENSSVSRPDFQAQAICSARDQFRKRMGHIKCEGRIQGQMERANGQG